jgi:hypothetical protein
MNPVQIGHIVANVTNLKRLKAEDFDEDNQTLVSQLALNLNPFLEQVAAAFNKNIDFSNLNQEVLTLQTKVTAAGIPVDKLEVKSSIKSKIKGIQVISVTNNTDDVTLSGAPFVTYALTTVGFNITHITGLVADKKYSITLIVIG